jgi:hypothetical protein
MAPDDTRRAREFKPRRRGGRGVGGVVATAWDGAGAGLANLPFRSAGSQWQRAMKNPVASFSSPC